ncbi:MAG: hydrogenase expression/formation protein HypE [Archaeoglobaceae archaeon]|nr:hydrogenase expression/formation protein HypE [Archaeoglobaceae archaeon]MCX8152407.1 hydrogenase expression/formation protein HypE [Archaeoglobaceae archaeon]MDW8013747.1 hydrogenase expression/formation protein HypE [Archaeoglobaceae archaeon]
MGKITLAHGSGGKEMNEILEKMIFKRLPDWMKLVDGGLGIDFPDDAAAIPLGDGRYFVVTIDSYTVDPIFFPGGNIGKLAASGTINDVLMLGGNPVAALDSIVVEEGFEEDLLKEILDSMFEVFKSNGVKLIGGDFKVMPRGQLDKIVITTVGLGIAEHLIVDKNLKPGDKVIVSGKIAEHGAAIYAAQKGFMPEESELRSDVKPLKDLIIPLVEKYGKYISAASDPTRGGLAMVLNSWASASGTMIVIDEEKVPLRDAVKNYCELLGLDPFVLASEGVAVLGVKEKVAKEVVEEMNSLGYTDAEIVGEVKEKEGDASLVIVKTRIGGYRILEPPLGEIVPRIC